MRGDALVVAMARAIAATCIRTSDDRPVPPEWCIGEANAALAALRQHRPDVAAVLDGWRTLDSAPRCGADFLMHYPRHSAINVVSWRGGMWQDAATANRAAALLGRMGA